MAARLSVALLTLRVGADDVRFDANVSRWWSSSVPATFETLQRAAQKHLRPEDYVTFQKATGASVQQILAGIRECDINATRDSPTLPHEALPAMSCVPLET